MIFLLWSYFSFAKFFAHKTWVLFILFKNCFRLCGWRLAGNHLV